jgi:single-stranded-DNA-specific exonuclease
VYLDGNDFIVNSIPGCDIYRRAFYGLFMTLCSFAEAGKISNSESIDEQFFGYYLAPTFNSIKRMGASMTEAFGVFFDAEPRKKISNLIALNDERKALEQKYIQEILSTPQPYAPYAYITTAPLGIVGLIAQKLMLASGEPTVVLVNDDGNKYHGSGRSPEWYPFFTRVHDKFYVGGHDVAFGIGITDKRELDAFVAFVKKDSADVKAVTEIVEAVPDFVIATDGTGDTVIDLWTFAEYLREVNNYKPYGKGFPVPQALLKFNASEGEWSVMGSAKQHLKIKLAYGFEVLLWNQAQYASLADSEAEVYIVGNIQSSEFNGNITFNFVGTVVENV